MIPASPRQALLDLYRDAIREGLSIQDVQQEIREFDEMVEQVHVLKQKEKRLRTPFWRVKRITPMVFLTLGSILIANVAWPLLYYTLFVSPSLQRNKLLAPIPQSEVLDPQVKAEAKGLVNPVSAETEFTKPKSKPIVLDEPLDYANLANWFTDADMIAQTAEHTEEQEYSIDIPALDIEDAKVKVGGTDLNNSLIQYPGTADPGEFGAPVIFGHSVLRQFYRPQETNPQRYKSIFSKIMTLKEGDEIKITFEGAQYVYVVEEKSEVAPEDNYILEQRHNSRLLKLITCVPEGTYLRRGIVLARLDRIE